MTGVPNKAANTALIPHSVIMCLSLSSIFTSFPIDAPIRHLFSKLSVAEYVALQSIEAISGDSAIYGGKAYLTDLSVRMQMSIRKTSKAVRDLRDRGYIKWSHDGNGTDGTYVTITDAGAKQLHEQETIIKDFYGNVINKFGKENMINLLILMKELDTVMESEIEEMQVVKNDDESDENE